MDFIILEFDKIVKYYEKPLNMFSEIYFIFLNLSERNSFSV